MPPYPKGPIIPQIFGTSYARTQYEKHQILLVIKLDARKTFTRSTSNADGRSVCVSQPSCVFFMRRHASILVSRYQDNVNCRIISQRNTTDRINHHRRHYSSSRSSCSPVFLHCPSVVYCKAPRPTYGLSDRSTLPSILQFKILYRTLRRSINKLEA